MRMDTFLSIHVGSLAKEIMRLIYILENSLSLGLLLLPLIIFRS